MTFCVFPVFSVAIMNMYCDPGAYGHHYFRSGCSASAVVGALGASTAVDRKSMGHTVAERSWKDADFLCNSCILRGGYEMFCSAYGGGK
jgi:hypothetical protein